MLADQQEALARLLVDAPLRRRWAEASDDDRGGAEWFADLELSGAELASLRSVDLGELERVAVSLAEKRRRAVVGTVPHCAALWPELGERYLELLAVAPARVEDLDPCVGPGASELLRLLPRLRAAAIADDAAPGWLADLLALELARACTHRDRRARSLRCAYPVHRVLEVRDRGWLSVELEPGPHEYRLDAERLRWRALEGS